jgi:hypothetical protein
MGGEVLVTAAAALGLLLFAFLLWRSLLRATRPYALPTLLFSCAIGIYGAWGKSPANVLFGFLIGFLAGAILFGAHAHAIKWLNERR